MMCLRLFATIKLNDFFYFYSSVFDHPFNAERIVEINIPF